MSKLILGQTLSSEAQPTGLGSGTSDMQEGVRQDIRAFDATMLSSTLRDQLVTQFCAINLIRGKVPKVNYGYESEKETKATISLLGSLASAGLEPDDAGVAALSERTGLGLRRKASSPSPIPFSATVAQATRERYARASQIIRESRSPSEAIDKLIIAFPDLAGAPLQTMIAETTGKRMAT
jgi:hypothetical protein